MLHIKLKGITRSIMVANILPAETHSGQLG